MIALGYDYGTTTSWMAMIKNLEEEPVLVSLKSSMFVSGNGCLLFGDEARNNMNKTGSFIKSPKRYLISHNLDKFKKDSNCRLDEVVRDFTARILTMVENDRVGQIGTDKEIYITVTIPNSYDGAQMRFMRQNIQEVLMQCYPNCNIHVSLLPEPIAAALFYAFNTPVHGGGREVNHIVTCDIGGGTTDLSVIRLERVQVEGTDLYDVSFKVEATTSNALLGGDDIDNILFDYLMEQTNADRRKLQNENQLRTQVTEAKESLSDESVKLASVSFTDIHNVNVQMDLSAANIRYRLDCVKVEDTKSSFNSSLCKLMGELQSKTVQLYKNAQTPVFEWKDAILLPIGGTMRIPELRKLFSEMFSHAKMCELSTEKGETFDSVVYGAMLHSAIMGKMDTGIRNVEIEGRTCMPVSVKYLDNRLYQIVDPNMPDGTYSTDKLRPVCVNKQGRFSIDSLQFFLRSATMIGKDDIPDCEMVIDRDFMANGRLADDIVIKVDIDVKNSLITRVAVSVENIDAQGNDFYQEKLINN